MDKKNNRMDNSNRIFSQIVPDLADQRKLKYELEKGETQKQASPLGRITALEKHIQGTGDIKYLYEQDVAGRVEGRNAFNCPNADRSSSLTPPQC